MRHPNILILLADQWRAQAFGYAGDPNARTPCLDRLAHTSIQVTHAVSGTPVCTPARASILTGQYPDRHGLFLNDAPLDPGVDSIGKRFAAAGYDTAWIGKWHIDGHGRTGPIPSERHHGFAYWKVLECTHAYHHSRYYAGDDPTPRVWDGYDADAQTQDAIGYLEHRPRERPFLLVLSWGPPHDPYDAAPEDCRFLPPAAVALRGNVPAGVQERARVDLSGYYAHGLALDRCVGRILDALDRLQLADDTLVVFTSDHGDMLGSHGLWCKQCPWDESIRVPLLLRWPRVFGIAGRTSDLVFDQVDLAPTLLAFAGISPMPGAEGRDLSTHLRVGTVPEDNAALYAQWQVFGTWPDWNRGANALVQPREARGIRTLGYTYVEDRDGPWLLYDHRSDPLQLQNLVQDRSAAGARDALRERLHGRMAARGDTFPRGAELVARWGYRVEPSGAIRPVN